MKSTLTIKDLCASKELDRKAMSAVRGGSDAVQLRHESVHVRDGSFDPPWQVMSPPGGFPPNGSIIQGAVPIN